MVTPQRFVKDIGIIGLTNISLFLKGIVVLPVITKLLGAQAYGVWTQLLVTLSLLTPFALLGMPAALVRFLAGIDDTKKRAESLWAMLAVVGVSAIIVAFILVTFRNTIADLLTIPPSFIVLLAGITLLECINSLLFNTFRAFHRMSRYAAFTLMQSFGEIVLTAGAVLLGYGLWGAVLSLFIIRIAVTIVLMDRLIREVGIAYPDMSHIGEYLRFGLPTVGSNLAYWVVTSSDRYIISFYLGIIAVGYYAPAYTLGNLLTVCIMPFSLVLPGVLARLFDQHDMASVGMYLTYSLKYFLLLAIPGVVGLWVLSSQLLIIFSTPEIARQGAWVVPLVALSMLCYGVYSILAQVFDIYKKTGISTMIWMGGALLNLLLNILLIPWLGIIGAGISTLVVYIAATSISWILATQRIPLSLDSLFLARSIGASLLMGVLVFFMEPQGIVEVLAATMVGVVVYILTLLFLGGISPKERAFLFSLLQNFRSALSQP